MEISEESKQKLLCSIYKIRNKPNCTNYRGIFLLNVTYKVLSINRRLVNSWRWRLALPMWLRKGEVSKDLIFVARRILKKSQKYNIDLHHLFIDFQQAYDSVDRYTLILDFLYLGLSRKLIRLRRMTLVNTRCKL